MPRWDVEKFRRICDAADGAHAALGRKSDALNEARVALGKAQMYRREYERNAANGRGVIGADQDAPYAAIGHAPGGGTIHGRPMVTANIKAEGIAELDRRVAEREAQLKRLQSEYDRLVEHWRPLGDLKHHLIEFLKSKGIREPEEAL